MAPDSMQPTSRSEVSRARPATAHYAGLDQPSSQTSPAVVRAALARWHDAAAPEGPVLDLGTGVGGNLSLLSRVDLVGTELSLAASRRASAIGPVVVADGAALPWRSGAFGAVVCTEVLEHVDDPDLVFAEIARVLRPDGVAYVTTPNYANLAGLHKWGSDRMRRRRDWNPWGAHEGGYEGFMTGRRLVRAARPHLDVVRVRGLDHGQAITGRFTLLDRMAWSAPGRAVMRRVLPALSASRGVAAWHGMHIELVLRRRG